MAAEQPQGHIEANRIRQYFSHWHALGVHDNITENQTEGMTNKRNMIGPKGRDIICRSGKSDFPWLVYRAEGKVEPKPENEWLNQHP